MRLRIALAAAVIAATAPAAPALAACEDRMLDFTGSAREAEFTGGGGPLGPRKLTIGEPVEGKLHAGGVYYVPEGKSLKVEFGGYTYRVAAKGVFIPQCSFGKGAELYFRLLERQVEVSGPRFSGNRSKGYVVTPEASFLPTPGKPSYTVSRKVTDKRRTTYSSASVDAGPSISSLFVKVSAAIGKKVACQAGKSVTIWLDGRTSSG
jgi:hypothetical protein